MQPNRFGRVLGVSTRIAADKIRERAAQMEEAASVPAPAKSAAPSSQRPVRKTMPSRGAAYAEGGRRLARGAGRFSSALIRPFAHTTGILSLQIFGVFFVLFALYFTSHVWQTWQASRWHDRHLMLYGGFALLFAWFAASSFWRASRKQKR